MRDSLVKVPYRHLLWRIFLGSSSTSSKKYCLCVCMYVCMCLYNYVCVSCVFVKYIVTNDELMLSTTINTTNNYYSYYYYTNVVCTRRIVNRIGYF
jgi:hypothetical protein